MEQRTILFQGDSITDAGRKSDSLGIGRGYPNLVGAHLGASYPYSYKFINRGLSGDRIVDLYARIKADVINLKPDYLSILIGINDVSHDYYHRNGVSADKFEMVYGMVIEELFRELPDLKLMLIEPFVLPGSMTISNPEYPARWEYFRTETDLRRAAVRRLADKYSLPFVPLQDRFSAANMNTTFMDYWVADGVHPTPAGHELIKQAWLEGFESMK